MRMVERRYWWVWITLSVALLSLGTANGQGVRRGYVPGPRHAEAYEVGRDCEIYLSVHRRVVDGQQRDRRTLAQVEAELMRRREALEQCGSANGIVRLGVEEEDELRQGVSLTAREGLLASACPRAYRAWLRPGYRWQALQEDLREAESATQRLSALLQMRCGQP